MATYSEDDRSSDGSDSEGSLVDFITKSEDEEVESEDEATDVPLKKDEIAKQLLEEFPYDKSLLNETNTSGPRRSRRQRKNITRYRDPEYEKLMMDDVEMDGIELSEEDVGDDSDEDFDVNSDSESESEEEEERTKVTDNKKIKLVKGKRKMTTCANESCKKKCK